MTIPPRMLTPDQIDRRTVLKRITLGAGAIVLQPFLNALAAEADGKAPPLRIVFVIESNGLWPYHIQPKGVAAGKGDRLIDLPLRDLELPVPIAPLAPFKDRMMIIQNLSCKQANPNHGAGYGALGCYRARDNANGTNAVALGQTVDHALAGAQPGIIPVVGLGVHMNPEAVFANTVSASAAKRPMPIVCQPEIAFQTLFGSVAEGNAAKVFQSRNKLLDWIQSDIRRVRTELPAMDREKLDIYLNTFEQMRSRQDKVAAIKDNLKANLPSINKFNSKLQTDRFEAQCVMAVAALASRLTNVAVIDASCGPHGYKTWKELGVNIDEHGIGHTHPDSPERDKNAVPIRQFHATRVADLAKRLAAIPEGKGTMLDSTLIVWMSDSAEEHHGQGMQWPMVLVGNLGGKLKTAGRYLQFPKYGEKGHRTLGNFYLSLLHAVGDKREKFGESDPALKDIDTAGPLAEILA